MEPYHYRGQDAELSVSIDSADLIQIRMSGNLSEDNLDAFLVWGEHVREAMRTVAARRPGRVLTLIDVRGTTEVDEKSTAALHELMLYNKQFATRTAVYGAEYFIRLIIDIALQVTKRNNMRVFDTRDEALTWLIGEHV